VRRTPCRGARCKSEVVWAIGESGQRIPLDPKAPVYQRIGQDPDGTIRVRRVSNVFVSHFATCVDASQFSGSKKAERS
jgi:hypothetical protein